MSERKPLTLEELRDIVGKPVWVETKRRKEWCILWGYHGPEVYGRAMIFTTRTAAKNQLLFEDYGKTWLAYATDPTSLDRSAWKPCAWCAGKACANCSRAETPSCNTCKTCKEHNHWEPDSKFCPDCGRPRTDAAWEMLEKRLEGIA